MKTMERRVMAAPLELRRASEADADARTLVGYAAVFGKETVIAGLFREQIAPGAFAASIGEDDVRALFNHDPNFVLGRTRSGTLTLAEDETGLRYEVNPPETTWANDLLVTVKRGDVSQSSFGFQVVKEEWTEPATRAELPLRTIREARLFDVSAVTYPAYADTSVVSQEARSTAEAMATAEALVEQVRAEAAAIAADQAAHDATLLRQKRQATVERLL